MTDVVYMPKGFKGPLMLLPKERAQRGFKSALQAAHSLVGDIKDMIVDDLHGILREDGGIKDLDIVMQINHRET